MRLGSRSTTTSTIPGYVNRTPRDFTSLVSSLRHHFSSPQAYYKVTGRHVLKNLPQTNVWFVLLVALGLVSWLVYVVQQQNHQRAVKYLRLATLHKLDPEEGGSPLTLNSHARALALYDEAIAAGGYRWVPLGSVGMCHP